MIELSASQTPRARACPPSIRVEELLRRLQERVQVCQEVAQAMANPVLRALWYGEAEGIEFCMDLIHDMEE
jgi:hypothetical protein